MRQVGMQGVDVIGADSGGGEKVEPVEPVEWGCQHTGNHIWKGEEAPCLGEWLLHNY
jgi:hypothetical protein